MLPCEAISKLLESTNKRISKQHATILQAIPNDRKDLLNTETGKKDETFHIELDSDTEPKLVTKLNCKTIYNTLLRRDTSSVDHPYRLKWANILGFVNWGKVFKSIEKSNVDRKAIDLRLEIIHRCIPTARRLAGKSQLFESSICKVCEQYEENLTHLFYLCSSAKKIWNYVNTLIRRRFPTYQEYQINFKDILCDFQDHNELKNIPVTGLLRDLGLRHIWQHRNRIIYDDQKSETLSVFKAKLRKKVKTEFQIAKSRER